MAAKILVSLPQEFLDDVDRLAVEERRSRSELIREALRVYLETRQEKKALRMVQEQQIAYDAQVRVQSVSSDENARFERLLLEREERLKVIARIRSRQPEVPPEEVEQDVAEAIRAVREQRRAQSSG